MNARKKIFFLFLVVFLGVLLRAVFLLQYSLSPLFDIPLGPDVSDYYQWAMDIRAGSLLWDELKIHSPFYAYFLAFLLEVCSGNIWPVRLLQSMLLLISGTALFYCLFIKNENSCENRKGIVAAFIFSIYPPLLYLSCEFYSEALLIPLICWTIIFEKLASDAKNERAAMLYSLLFGLFSALTVLTHPLSMLFVLANFAFFIYLFLRNNAKIAKYSVFLAVSFFISVLLPVSVYNGLNFGKYFPFQANSGFNFYLGNNPTSDGTCMLRPGPDWDRIHAQAEYAVQGTGLSKDQYFIFKSLDFILNNPIRYAVLLVEKAFLVWNRTELISGADLSVFRYFTPLQRSTAWSFALLGTVSLFTLFYSFLSKRKLSLEEKIFIILLFSFWIAQILTVTSSRYRAAMLPALMLLASVFANEISFFFSKERRVLLSFCMISSFLIVCVFPAPLPKKEKSEAATILAEAYLRKGEPEKAEELLLKAVKLDPDWSRNYNMLGIIYQDRGDYQKARDYFFRALNCFDSDKSALMNLAMLFDEMGDIEHSEYFWTKAMKEEISADLMYNYSVKLQNKGKINEALEYSLKALQMNPSHTGALNNTGVILMLQNNNKKALQYLEKAYKFSEKKFDVGINYAVCLDQNGYKEKAKKILCQIAKFANSKEQKEKLGKAEELIGK